MAISRIILWLGNGLALVAALLALTAFFGFFLADANNAFGMLTISGLVGLMGAILVGATRFMPGRVSQVGSLAILLLFWVAIPPVLALPFWIMIPDISFMTSYFEAVSAVTTTGASTLVAEDVLPILHLWRSALQWSGGVIAATFAVVILAALNLQGSGVHRSMLFTLRKGDLFSQLLQIGGVIAAIYGGISLVCFLGLILSGAQIFDAFCLALTSISTGGLTPQSGVLASYVNPFGVLVLALTCIAGSFNVTVLWDVFRLRSLRSLKSVLRNAEHRALLSIIGAIVVMAVFYTGPPHLLTVVFEAVFFATSTGYDYHIIGLDVLPQTVLIAFSLIGGSALSTAGGIKLIRFLLLFRHLETDLSRLTYPSRMVPVIFRGEILPDKAFLSIWMYFFGYSIVFAGGFMMLGATGMDFNMAVTTSAASLANMGPLLEMTLPDYGYSEFSQNQLAVASIIMILGRVEILAFLTILTPGLWRS